MEMQPTYPRVRTVRARANWQLLVSFDNGQERLYDCRPLLQQEAFQPLTDEAFFHQVRPEPHGYAVIWSDDIDLAESELWLNGRLVESTVVSSAGSAGAGPATRTGAKP